MIPGLFSWYYQVIILEGEQMEFPEQEWKKAKKLCRLNGEDIRIAKEMGLNPKSLIKNIPNKDQQWKEPVRDWL